MKFKFRGAAAAQRHRRVENTCIEHAAKLILVFSPSSNSFVVFGFDKRTPILASQSVSGALRYFPSLLGAPAQRLHLRPARLLPPPELLEMLEETHSYSHPSIPVPLSW